MPARRAIAFDRPRRRRASRWAPAGIAALLVALGGCAYRIDVQQGNVIEPEAVAQVEVGMTRSQVQFLLGTPLITDPFHANRWDYAYYYRQGRKRSVERRWVSVYFEEDRVARVERRQMGDDGAFLEPETETASRRDE